nr:TlpA disulfide reductase family protein [uncultured Caldimonas sp.]
MNRRQWTVLAGAGSLAALAGMGAAWWRGSREAPAAIDPLWQQAFETPQGEVLRLRQLRGKPLVVNFWATWCAPCVREMPQLDRFHREFEHRGWQVLGIAIDNKLKVQEFLQKVPVGFPIVLGGSAGMELVRILGNPQGGLPFTVAYGAGGQVTHRKLGETSHAELVQWAAGAPT